MKKHWLAVIGDNDLSIAKIAVGKNQEMKVLYHADFKGNGPSPGQEECPLDANSVRQWLRSQKIPLKNLKLATSSLGLITRVISLPQVSNEDVDKLITDHIDQFFTLNMNNYIVDYRILKKYQEDNKPMINVFLAAFPRERMEFLWGLCKDIGFEPKVIDLTVDCLVRIYSKLEKPIPRNSESVQEGSAPGDMAIVSLQRDKVEFILTENSVFFLHSDLEIDLEMIANRYYTNSKQIADILSEERKPLFKQNVLATVEPEDEIKLELSSYMDDEVDLYPGGDIEPELNIPDHEKDYFHRITRMNQDVDSFLKKDSHRLLDDDDHRIKPLDDDILSHELDAKLKEQSDILNQLIGLESEYVEDHDSDDSFDDVFSDESLLEDEEFIRNLKKGFPELDFSLGLNEPKEEKKSFKQAALQMGQSTREEEKFVLEDLFVPLDQLNQDLAITKNHQETKLLHKDTNLLFEEQLDRPELIKASVEESLPWRRNDELIQPEAYFQNDVENKPETFLESACDPETVTETHSEESLGSKDVGMVPFGEEDPVVNPEENQEEKLYEWETEIQSLQEKPSEERSIFDTLDLQATAFTLQKPEDLLIPTDPREELENNLAPVLANLSELLGFFAARHYGNNVQTIYLTGEYATIPFVEEIFEANLGIKTLAGFPNNWQPQIDKKNASIPEAWKKYGALYGLALRED